MAKSTSAEQRFQLSTDGFKPYNYAVGTQLHERVDYGQLVKVYAAPTPEEQRRYSPAHVVEAIATEVYGDRNPGRVCTSHTERQNGSLRQWCKRLTRLTYAFGKKWDHMKAALALDFAYYNFCRKHGSLKGAMPAMKAALTDRVWGLKDLLA